MRQLYSCILLILLTFGLVVSDASAGRFGGGRSFGMMRAKSVFSRANSGPRIINNVTRRSNWRGMFSGLLIGSLLTSLFMGHGFAAGMFSWFMLGLVVVMIVNLLGRRKQEEFNRDR